MEASATDYYLCNIENIVCSDDGTVTRINSDLSLVEFPIIAVDQYYYISATVTAPNMEILGIMILYHK